MLLCFLFPLSSAQQNKQIKKVVINNQCSFLSFTYVNFFTEVVVIATSHNSQQTLARYNIVCIFVKVGSILRINDFHLHCIKKIRSA